MTRTVDRPDTKSIPVVNPEQLFIDGVWVSSSTRGRFDVTDSASESSYFSVPEASDADMLFAIDAARRAFDGGPWPRLSHAERAEYLDAMADALRARVDTLSTIWSRQTGVVNAMARASTSRMPDVVASYAHLAVDYPFLEPRTPTAGGNYGLLVREPVGVVAAIIPWNAPMTTMIHKLAPALLAGCTVVLKPSPEAPGEAYVVAEVAEQVGLPPGVLNVLTADRRVSELLVTDPRVDKVAFTGSTAAGRRIASLLGSRVGRCTLELGGKSAAVILDDADLDEAAAALGAAGCFLTGQVCGSLTRLIVSQHRHDEFVNALVKVVSAVRVGDPFDPESQMGPLVSAQHRDRVEELIAAGRAEGADVALGGGRPSHLPRGFYLEPTIFAQVDNHSTIARTEVFGPVLSVIAAEDDNDAVAIANDSIYGLNASVFTPDADRALAVARRLRSGTVGHNAMRGDFGLGFGGMKQSGIGREGGTEGLAAYLETKTVILDAAPVAGPAATGS